jgi:hypothetical protein
MKIQIVTWPGAQLFYAQQAPNLKVDDGKIFKHHMVNLPKLPLQLLEKTLKITFKWFLWYLQADLKMFCRLDDVKKKQKYSAL